MLVAWKEISVGKQRKLFIIAYLEEHSKMAEICRQFGISRPTGYKWAKRHEEEGAEGLVDRSKARLVQNQATDSLLVDEILAVKFRWPKWGPKKVRGHLVVKEPIIIWPSTTTIGHIFDKNGLTVPRKYRKRFPIKTDPLAHANDSNKVWSVDFKGWWLTNDRHKCGPLTLVDNFSRFLLRCIRLKMSDGDHVWALLDAAFREYGLPDYMRSDNGPPFATSSVGRLSTLSIKLVKAGIMPEWIEPGNPQENGRHERVHGTLQQEGVFPELDLEDQEKKLAICRDYYNFERPHEALGQVTPGSIYSPSLRTWNGRLNPPEYPDDFIVGRVRNNGNMSWKGGDIYVGRVLDGELVGIEKTQEGQKVYFGTIFLGIITKENELEVVRRKGRIRRKIPVKEV
jgi:putative transposase